MPDMDAIIAFLAVAVVVSFVSLGLVIWSLLDNPSCTCNSTDKSNEIETVEADST